MILFECVFIFILGSFASALNVDRFPVLVDHFRPEADEFYLCTAVKIARNKTFYVVGFEPKASEDVVHHMMLFGCPQPGLKEKFWDCGEMSISASSTLKRGNPCRAASNVIYGWARGADALQLPDDVGFEIGAGTDVQYLVMQVHYSKKFPENMQDNSGVVLKYTEKPQSKLAGVVMLGTGGSIPPYTVTHMEAQCRLTEDKTIYPFAYRTHAHSLARVVSGYRVRETENGHFNWTLLGKRDPLTPQMFYPVFDKSPITTGDILAARCTYASDRSITTKIGPTNDDEMCNYYIMYYVKEGKPLNMKYCITTGPPSFYWDIAEEPLGDIPDEDASSLP